MFPFLRTEKSELIGEIRGRTTGTTTRMVYLPNELVMVLTSFPSRVTMTSLSSTPDLFVTVPERYTSNEAVAKDTRIGTKNNAFNSITPPLFVFKLHHLLFEFFYFICNSLVLMHHFFPRFQIVR